MTGSISKKYIQLYIERIYLIIFRIFRNCWSPISKDWKLSAKNKIRRRLRLESTMEFLLLLIEDIDNLLLILVIYMIQSKT